VVFLKLGFGLAFRNCLPRQYRIEGPSIGLVLELLFGGPLRFDHFPFTFSPSRRLAASTSVHVFPCAAGARSHSKTLPAAAFA
jgi:hypothetical protein